MTVWLRSSRCGDGACVEVARDHDDVCVRDSKTDDGPELRFTREEWDAFLSGVHAGEFAFGLLPTVD